MAGASAGIEGIADEAAVRAFGTDGAADEMATDGVPAKRGAATLLKRVWRISWTV